MKKEFKSFLSVLLHLFQAFQATVLELPLSYNKRNPISCKIDEEDGRPAESQTDLKGMEHDEISSPHPSCLLKWQSIYLSYREKKGYLKEKRTTYFKQNMYLKYLDDYADNIF